MITNNNLIFNSSKTSKIQVFEEIGTKVASQKLASKAAVVDALNKRKKHISAGIEKEFAITYRKVKGLKKLIVVIAKFSKNEISWDSTKGKNIKLAIIILAPETALDENLEILEKLSAILTNIIFANMVKKMTKGELVKLINNLEKIPFKKFKTGKVNQKRLLKWLNWIDVNQEKLREISKSLNLNYDKLEHLEDFLTKGKGLHTRIFSAKLNEIQKQVKTGTFDLENFLKKIDQNKK